MDLRSGVDVADISGNAWSVSDIIERKLRNKRVKLHEESQGLADPSSCAQDGDFPVGYGFSGISSAEEVLSGGRSSYGSKHFCRGLKLKSGRKGNVF